MTEFPLIVTTAPEGLVKFIVPDELLYQTLIVTGSVCDMVLVVIEVYGELPGLRI